MKFYSFISPQIKETLKELLNRRNCLRLLEIVNVFGKYLSCDELLAEVKSPLSSFEDKV